MRCLFRPVVMTSFFERHVLAQTLFPSFPPQQILEVNVQQHLFFFFFFVKSSSFATAYRRNRSPNIVILAGAGRGVRQRCLSRRNAQPPLPDLQRLWSPAMSRSTPWKRRRSSVRKTPSCLNWLRLLGSLWTKKSSSQWHHQVVQIAAKHIKIYQAQLIKTESVIYN